MMKTIPSVILLANLVLLSAGCKSTNSELNLPRRATQSEINENATAALTNLYATVPQASELASTAKGILVFPRMYKAGLIIGGQFGDGVMYSDGKAIGYYNTTAASYGLQAGAQEFSYALYFMTDKALEYVKKSEGWEIGVGPSLVLVDEGVAKTLSTTTAKDDIYAFIFGQKGLMAGLGITGTKVTPINPAP